MMKKTFDTQQEFVYVGRIVRSDGKVLSEVKGLTRMGVSQSLIYGQAYELMLTKWSDSNFQNLDNVKLEIDRYIDEGFYTIQIERL